MLRDALMLAAEAGANEEETSKTAFYVAGSVLAAWAVVVSIIGFTRHEFPGGRGAARGVMLLSAVLVAATMASAVLTG